MLLQIELSRRRFLASLSVFLVLPARGGSEAGTEKSEPITEAQVPQEPQVPETPQTPPPTPQANETNATESE